MGSRKLSAARQKRESRTIALIIGATVSPLFLAYILIAADIRPDLSELKPILPLADASTLLLGWNELENPAQSWALKQQPRWAVRPQVRMLGYMMDTRKPFRESAMLDTFLLMPDAGHILHPAHRIPDQMVEVRLAHSEPFRYRRLVWVSGTLTRRKVSPPDEIAAWLLTGAHAEMAADRDITRCFAP